MKDIILKEIEQQKNIRVSTLELQRKMKEIVGDRAGFLFYKEFDKAIIKLVEEEKLKPLKTTKAFSRNAKLFNKYAIVREKEELTAGEAKSLFSKYNPKISVGFYLDKPFDLKRDSYYLEEVSKFFDGMNGELEEVSVNERSYEIFGDEKFLLNDEGQRFIRNIGVTLSELGCYITREPFFYYLNKDKSVSSVRTALIVENKDTFYSFRKLIKQGVNTWGGYPVDLLIYGEGKKIISSILYLEDIEINPDTPILYFGDIDVEGVDIYRKLREKLIETSEFKVEPFVYLYIELLNRRKGDKKVPTQRLDKQSINLFVKRMPLEIREKMQSLLLDMNIIPQEALNITQLRRLSDGL